MSIYIEDRCNGIGIKDKMFRIEYMKDSYTVFGEDICFDNPHYGRDIEDVCIFKGFGNDIIYVCLNREKLDYIRTGSTFWIVEQEVISNI